MRLAAVVLVVAAWGCEEDDLPPPPPIGGPAFDPGGAVAPGGALGPPTPTPTPTSTTTTTSTPPSPTDGDDVSDTDLGTSDTATDERECRSSCDCAPLQNCTVDGCVPAAEIRYCCADALCPSGAPCETPDARLSVCP
jgi:hypothetical protein